MKDILGMMKQVQEIQDRMQRAQEDLAALSVEGQSGAGMIKVTMSGKGDMKAIRIDPSLVRADEVEMLEDLIIAATQDAKARLESVVAEKMKEVTGGLPLPPGLKLF